MKPVFFNGFDPVINKKSFRCDLKELDVNSNFYAIGYLRGKGSEETRSKSILIPGKMIILPVILIRQKKHINNIIHKD